eukprot:3940029-Rhodomonas_salina.3
MLLRTARPVLPHNKKKSPPGRAVGSPNTTAILGTVPVTVAVQVLASESLAIRYCRRTAASMVLP